MYWALSNFLPNVALAIVARADFRAINAKDETGMTALHWAVNRGYLDVCKAIVGRKDFTELRTPADGGSMGAGTAYIYASELYRTDIANFLKEAMAAEKARARVPGPP